MACSRASFIRVVLAGWPQQPAGDGDVLGLDLTCATAACWLAVLDDPEIVHADLVICGLPAGYPHGSTDFGLDYPRGQSAERGRWWPGNVGETPLPT